MTNHKFVYTVSGIDLSDAQKADISQKIAATVAAALAGHQPKALKSGFSLTGLHILGGIFVDATDVEFGIETLNRALAELEGLQPRHGGPGDPR